MNMITRLITTGLLYAVTIVTGIILSRLGKPLNNALFTVHKLIALAAVVIAAILVRDLLHNTRVSATIITLMIIICLLIVLLFASGALLSLDHPARSLWQMIHRIAPLAVFILMPVLVFMLMKGQTSL